MPIDRIGLCSWSLQQGNPQSLVEAVKETALDAVQLAMTPMVLEPESWGSCLERLAAAEIRVLSGMMAPLGEDYSSLKSIARTGGLRPDATWPGNEEMAGSIARLAAEHGIDLVTLHAGFMPESPGDPERSVIIDRLRRLVDIHAEVGVSVALETGQETAATLLEVIADVERDTLGVNFDPANMILYGMGDPIEALQALGPHVLQLHIKDAVSTDVPGTWGREVPVGSGEVDWSAFLEIVETLPRTVHAVIEREAGDDRVTDIQGALRFLEGTAP